MKAGFFFE